jgi:hypothetical protein
VAISCHPFRDFGVAIFPTKAALAHGHEARPRVGLTPASGPAGGMKLRFGVFTRVEVSLRDTLICLHLSRGLKPTATINNRYAMDRKSDRVA